MASVSRNARQPPSNMVVTPARTTHQRHTPVSLKIGAVRANNTMPALTMVAECKYALTGVGAAIAPGNQKWNGNCADLVNAPSNSIEAATLAIVPVGARSCNFANDVVPNWFCSKPMPTNMHNPPAPVVSSARTAERRATSDLSCRPISKNDHTDVSSQKINMVNRSSASTSPVIDPAKAINSPTKRVNVASCSKYAIAYASTAKPSTLTNNAMTTAKPST